MADTDFTPGPWFTDGARRQRYVDDSGEVVSGGAIGVFAEAGVACVAFSVPGCLPANGRDDATKANANLIAAAPDLYEALTELLQAWTVGLDTAAEDIDIRGRARAALRKAEGRT